jgi:hypothetical protein
MRSTKMAIRHGGDSCSGPANQINISSVSILPVPYLKLSDQITVTVLLHATCASSDSPPHRGSSPVILLYMVLFTTQLLLIHQPPLN